MSRSTRGGSLSGGRTPVGRLQNIGVVSAGWLEAVGIRTRGDLEQIGAVEAYLRVRFQQPGATLNLLYALEGALTDTKWTDLPCPVKKDLARQAAELEP